MFWDYWLQLARDGSDESATHMLGCLAASVETNAITAAQREFLSGALRAIAAAPAGKARDKAAKVHLLLGRRPGRVAPYRAREERLARAWAVWDVAGHVKGAALDRACETAANALSTGQAENHAPDLRAFKTAYLEYLPTFLAIQAVAREPEDSGLGGGF